MNINKILVTLVIAFAVVGLTGAASAYSTYGNGIDTNTDITGTHFTSSSQTRISGMPVTSHYTQFFVAELVGPVYPPDDFSYTDIDIRGNRYSQTSSIRSTPTRNFVSTEIANPSDVSGTKTRYNCAQLGHGREPEEVTYPLPIYKPSEDWWMGTHRVGAAYPAHSREAHSISWGSGQNWP